MLELAFDAVVLLALFLGLPASRAARAVIAVAAVLFVVRLVLFLGPAHG